MLNYQELSSLEKLSLLSKEARLDYLSHFTSDQLERLLASYAFIARPKQKFPSGNWRTWLIGSGRGFGKTFIGANWVLHQAQTQKYPIALVGANAADVRDYMIEVGESSIIKQSPKWFTPQYQPSKRRLIFPNGVIAIAYSADNPDQLRGFNGNSAWIDELAKFQYPVEVWDNLNFALRLGDNPKTVITTTPRPIKLIRQLYADKDVIKTFGSTNENRSNLASSFVDFIYKKYDGTRLGRQELSGELLTDVPGALFNYDNLDRCRVTKAPELKQIIISVDPAVTAEEGSNETGIVVCGIDEQDHGYLLEDKSGIYHPLEWGKIAVDLYTKYKADYIVAEVNQGGDLVANNINQVGKSLGFRHIPVKSVHATRGKALRAEPIATLYEQEKIHHVGSYPDLEDQITTWVPGDKFSPDRLDAIVWAFTFLLIKQVEISTLGESLWN